jgi:hypothetical protein
MLDCVLPDNPCRRFYKAIGGLQSRSKVVDAGGAQLEEVAYGWTDIRGLLI